MNLNAAIGDIGGDFDLAFRVSAPELVTQVRDLIFELSELDEPPRPLARIHPAYPTQARLRAIEGVVVLQFVVSPDGTTRDIEIVKSEPVDVFDNAAMRAVKRWRFTPGTRGGEPVAVRVRQRVTFKLD